ncbi:MAG: ABC transporter permease [Deltaproteobacteria bacterium]|nr:ABC transporter permease [Deltaproteobacteria bacterium]
MLAGLWRYRSFILSMVRREFEARYLGSALGSVWAILNPLAMIFIYTVIFGQVMRSRLPGVEDGTSYGIFLCAGVLTWNMFAEILQRSVSVFVEQGNLLKKMTFPRAALPAIVVLSATLNFAIVMGLLLLVLLLLGRFPGWSLLGFLPLLAVQQSVAVGFGVGLGVLNVFFRDVGHVVAILLQFWFWFTPIIYPLSILSDRLRPLLRLNPMTDLVAGYQGILLHGEWPFWLAYLPHVVLAVAALLVGRLVFRRLAAEMTDYL